MWYSWSGVVLDCIDSSKGYENDLLSLIDLFFFNFGGSDTISTHMGGLQERTIATFKCIQ